MVYKSSFGGHKLADSNVDGVDGKPLRPPRCRLWHRWKSHCGPGRSSSPIFDPRLSFARVLSGSKFCALSQHGVLEGPSAFGSYALSPSDCLCILRIIKPCRHGLCFDLPAIRFPGKTTSKGRDRLCQDSALGRAKAQVEARKPAVEGRSISTRTIWRRAETCVCTAPCYSDGRKDKDWASQLRSARSPLRLQFPAVERA
jgi:hypothetical protein